MQISYIDIAKPTFIRNKCYCDSPLTPQDPEGRLRFPLQLPIVQESAARQGAVQLQVPVRRRHAAHDRGREQASG